MLLRNILLSSYHYMILHFEVVIYNFENEGYIISASDFNVHAFFIAGTSSLWLLHSRRKHIQKQLCFCRMVLVGVLEAIIFFKSFYV